MVRAPILLKLSGEALGGDADGILNTENVNRVCREIVAGAKEYGQPVAIVVGGGNIMRGRIWDDHGAMTSDPARGDQMGMLATLINAIALRDGIERVGGEARIMAPYAIPQVAEVYDYTAAQEALQSGTIVIFGGGTGHPFLTTDTAAAMRGAQIRASAVLKGSNVDGIYDMDPAKHQDACRYDKLSFQQALEQGLGIMDTAAFALCQERNLPIRVFDMNTAGNLRAACGPHPPGTLVEPG